jgi:hypothetical protein
MNRKLTMAQGRRLRDLASIAYERELSIELEPLEADFQRWRAGEINAFGLSDEIHAFHQEAARDLFKKYNANVEIAVAQAIHFGILSKDDVGSAIFDYLGRFEGMFSR